MKALEVNQHIELKNILFATDLDISAHRALPFAAAVADHFGAKLYAAHVVAVTTNGERKAVHHERLFHHCYGY